MNISFFRSCSLTFCFIITGLCYAQEYLDLAKVSYLISPEPQFDNGSLSNTIKEWNFQLDLPMVLNDNNAIIFSGATNIYNISLHPDQLDNTRLYAINLRLGLNTIYNDVWSGTYLAIPKITTDFSNGLRKGYQIGFVALLNQKKSTRLKYTYGLFTNTEEYGQLIVPLLGGYYLSPDEKIEVTALLPALVDVNYKLAPKTSLGFSFEGLGTTYTFESKFYKNVYMTRGSNQLTAYSQFQLSTSLFLRTKVGYELRTYRIFDQADTVALSLASIYINDNRTILNSELKDGMFFRLEMFYRFNLPKQKIPSLNEKL